MCIVRAWCPGETCDVTVRPF
uniref:Uncharacterized protein n=1 Tax=Anguilla anguilla TaxID=7936 RepID=A0A0E9VX57_ANGAN